MGEISQIIEPQIDEQQALPYGEELAPKGHKDFLEWVRTPRPGRAVHSDGFLALSGLVKPAYECPSCGFSGVFVSERCTRCNAIL